MKRTTALYCVATAVALSVAACSGSSQSPTSPSSVTETESAANPDGSTLKVTAPALLSPVDGVRLDTRRPAFTWANAAGIHAATALGYRLELLDAAGTLIDARNVPGADNVTQYVSDVDLAYSTDFQWRVRAELDGQPGPYSAAGSFRTPDPPANGFDPGPVGPSGGPVGPTRGISLGEAYSIIVNVHNTLRFNLGSGSSRNSRVQFLWAAVAAIHYGHSRFNPQGGDPNWCVKDGGGGRPPSDDVLVRCGSREAWDLVGGAGANGYRFHLDFIGRLDGRQNVYPPPRSALGRLGN